MAGRSISEPAPEPALRSAVRLTVVLCLAEVLGMAGTMTFPALLPTFFAQWGIGNVEAAGINGGFHARYGSPAPAFVTLTRRPAPRRPTLFFTATSAPGPPGLSPFPHV